MTLLHCFSDLRSVTMSHSPVDDFDNKEGIDATTKPTSFNSPTPLIGAKSPGVARIEALNAHTSFINRCCIFFGIFLVAYAYGLDGTLRYTYQPYATAGF